MRRSVATGQSLAWRRSEVGDHDRPETTEIQAFSAERVKIGRLVWSRLSGAWYRGRTDANTSARDVPTDSSAIVRAGNDSIDL